MVPAQVAALMGLTAQDERPPAKVRLDVCGDLPAVGEEIPTSLAVAEDLDSAGDYGVRRVEWQSTTSGLVSSGGPRGCPVARGI